MDSKAIYKLMVKKCPNTKRNKHYLKRYVRFITACLEKNKDLPEDVYTEKHHILPGGLNTFGQNTEISETIPGIKLYSLADNT